MQGKSIKDTISLDTQSQLKTLEKSSQGISCERCNGEFYVLEKGLRYRFCSCVEERRIESLWEHYGFNRTLIKKISDYEGYDDITKTIKYKSNRYIEDFPSLYGKRKNSFGILGQSGAGKTHICRGIGAALVNMSYRVRYMSYVDGMCELRGCYGDVGVYEELRNGYLMADVLIIDDLFKDKLIGGKVLAMDGVELGIIFSILDYRYNRGLPIIFSSECSMFQLLSIDEGLCGRIVESCGDNLICVFGRGYNYRIR